MTQNIERKMKKTCTIGFILYLTFTIFCTFNFSSNQADISQKGLKKTPFVTSWWNTTYEQRIKIDITEPNIANRTWEMVSHQFNFSSSACYNNSIKIIRNDVELPFQLSNAIMYGPSNLFYQSVTISFYVDILKGATISVYLYYSAQDRGISLFGGMYNGTAINFGNGFTHWPFIAYQDIFQKTGESTALVIESYSTCFLNNWIAYGDGILTDLGLENGSIYVTKEASISQENFTYWFKRTFYRGDFPRIKAEINLTYLRTIPMTSCNFGDQGRLLGLFMDGANALNYGNFITNNSAGVVTSRTTAGSPGWYYHQTLAARSWVAFQDPSIQYMPCVIIDSFSNNRGLSLRTAYEPGSTRFCVYWQISGQTMNNGDSCKLTFWEFVIDSSDYNRIQEQYRIVSNPVIVVTSNSAPVPPTISTPSNVEYVVGTTGHAISWIVSDPDVTSPSYIIYRDGVSIDSGSWTSGDTITANVDGLAIGDYNYTIVVQNGFGDEASDEVMVNVIQAPPGVPGYFAIIIIGAAGLSIILRIKKDHLL